MYVSSHAHARLGEAGPAAISWRTYNPACVPSTRLPPPSSEMDHRHPSAPADAARRPHQPRPSLAIARASPELQQALPPLRHFSPYRSPPPPALGLHRAFLEQPTPQAAPHARSPQPARRPSLHPSSSSRYDARPSVGSRGSPDDGPAGADSDLDAAPSGDPLDPQAPPKKKRRRQALSCTGEWCARCRPRRADGFVDAQSARGARSGATDRSRAGRACAAVSRTSASGTSSNKGASPRLALPLLPQHSLRPY